MGKWMSRTFCANTLVIISSQKPCWHLQQLIFTRKGAHIWGQHIWRTPGTCVHDLKSAVLPLQSAAAFGMSCDLISFGHVTRRCEKTHPTATVFSFQSAESLLLVSISTIKNEWRAATDTKLVSRTLISQVTMSAFVLLSEFCINWLVRKGTEVVKAVYLALFCVV